ncbi:MAG: hypothetical protein K9M07_02340 [Simkaniaceae bacterium]|nr:hypothetical protein [Simkaniaceae bacterium]MCF7852061.1 hypothetical protein [Simkaniaceae bacterium]
MFDLKYQEEEMYIDPLSVAICKESAPPKSDFPWVTQVTRDSMLKLHFQKYY